MLAQPSRRNLPLTYQDSYQQEPIASQIISHSNQTTSHFPPSLKSHKKIIKSSSIRRNRYIHTRFQFKANNAMTTVIILDDNFEHNFVPKDEVSSFKIEFMEAI